MLACCFSASTLCVLCCVGSIGLDCFRMRRAHSKEQDDGRRRRRRRRRRRMRNVSFDSNECARRHTNTSRLKLYVGCSLLMQNSIALVCGFLRCQWMRAHSLALPMIHCTFSLFVHCSLMLVRSLSISLSSLLPVDTHTQESTVCVHQ